MAYQFIDIESLNYNDMSRRIEKEMLNFTNF